MPITTLVQEDFASFQFNGISIQEISTNKNLLIMMLTNEESSSRFLNILKKNEFKLLITENTETGRFFLIFQFEGTDFDIQIDTYRKMESYPPLEKFKNNNIHYISTGVWNDGPEHHTFTYHHDIHRLGDLDIGNSLGQATAVQFDSFGSDEPSTISLTFKDYDHIIDAEADLAYNKLLDLKLSRPLLEISPRKDGLVDLRIWDILIDLDIKIKGLAFSREKLEKFLKNNDDCISFAFVLGFPPTDDEAIHIANTKHGDFKIITIFGYVYKKLPS